MPRPHGASQNSYIRFHFTGALELSLMVLDFYEYTGDGTDLDKYLPIAVAVRTTQHPLYPPAPPKWGARSCSRAAWTPGDVLYVKMIFLRPHQTRYRPPPCSSYGVEFIYVNVEFIHTYARWWRVSGSGSPTRTTQRGARTCGPPRRSRRTSARTRAAVLRAPPTPPPTSQASWPSCPGSSPSRTRRG